MAINSDENQNDSNNWKINTLLRKPASCNNESLTSSTSSRSKRNTKSMVSPYLNSDKVQLHSKLKEKKIVNRNTDYISSFPLAAKIYKANSDEFKIPKRVNKKAKKCVHALPNNPDLIPQACTVSDMNDSEYSETKNSRKLKPKLKKRRANKKPILPNKNIEIYDRDARYCSQLNINLDSSSTDMFKHLTGDGGKVLRKPKNIFGRNQVIDNDVWAVLRNINKIQFIPSPPVSKNSMESLKKKKCSRKRPSDRTDTSYIETCRTEEFAYISYESTSLNSNSRSSSFDRVTVIGKQDEFKTNSAQISSNEPMQKFGSITNQQRNFSGINIYNNKTDIIDNTERQQQHKSKVQTYRAPSQRKETDTHVANKDKDGNNEKSFSIAETKSSMTKMLTLKTDFEKSSLTSVPQQKEQLNGITRVVLSKGKDVENSNNCKKQEVVAKPRLVTTMLSTGRGITKCTPSDIKRRLAQIKYPLIVTAKDQVSSSIQIVDYETPQFYGLDTQIWPFMLNWLPEFQKNHCSLIKERVTVTAQKDNSMENRNINLDNDVVLHKKARNFQINSKSLDLYPTKSKGKHIRQFRDKMMNLVYNKSSNFQNKQDHNTKQISIEAPSTHVSMETQTYCNRPLMRKDKFYLPIDNLVKDHVKTKARHTWSKGKWASDFIENIIRKVKCGVYYGQEHHRNLEAESKYTQTETFVNNANIIDKVDVFKEDNDTFDDLFDYEVIPGFKDTIQGLELEAITKNQITIKHSNITVHFDVAFPFETNRVLQKEKSFFHLPVEVTQRRVYKCKATIENAVLPAELCSIFPKMLNNIYDSNILSLLPVPIDKLDCYPLLPIKEITQYDCYDSNNRSSAQDSLISHTLKNARFSPIITHDNYFIKRKPFTFDVAGYSTRVQLLPKLNLESLLDNFNTYIQITRRISSIHRPIVFDKFDDNIVKPSKKNTCTAIVPYIPKLCAITDFTMPRHEFSFVEAKKTIQPFVYFNLQSIIPFKLECFGTRTVVSLLNNAKSHISFVVNKTNVDLLYKHSGGDVVTNDVTSTLFHEEKNCNDFYLERKKQIMYKSGSGLIINKLNRNRKSIRLNKKCKSTSSIPYYKKSTPLQRIANLDEFFQAFGSAKYLAGVIDGNAERKILSSIVEMKSWITDMTPRQALLILLLANKNETSNLIRFRNVILQGIAMNRITKASELEMEIEVIERETLNDSPHFEGISYVPASIENKYNLLEELCWIAKTTAADYQKPFDRSSERLLKSLLSKRKKLNPSYLRVMARYVGLGLLKAK